MRALTSPQRIVISVVLGLAAVLALVMLAYSVRSVFSSNKTNAETVHEQATTAESTSAITGELQEQQSEVAADQDIISNARSSYEQQHRTAIIEDPTARDWVAHPRPIPQRLRDAARARRAARDGLGADAAGAGDTR